MPKNKMSDLRDHLFETLEALKDETNPMDLNRARAIREVASVLIDSARVEVELIEAMDGTVAPAEFFEVENHIVEGDRMPRLKHPQYSKRIA